MIVTPVGQHLPCSIHKQSPGLGHTDMWVTWVECVPLGKLELHKLLLMDLGLQLWGMEHLLSALSDGACLLTSQGERVSSVGPSVKKGSCSPFCFLSLTFQSGNMGSLCPLQWSQTVCCRWQHGSCGHCCLIATRVKPSGEVSHVQEKCGTSEEKENICIRRWTPVVHAHFLRR